MSQVAAQLTVNPSSGRPRSGAPGPASTGLRRSPAVALALAAAVALAGLACTASESGGDAGATGAGGQSSGGAGGAAPAGSGGSGAGGSASGTGGAGGGSASGTGGAGSGGSTGAGGAGSGGDTGAGGAGGGQPTGGAGGGAGTGAGGGGGSGAGGATGTGGAGGAAGTGTGGAPGPGFCGGTAYNAASPPQTVALTGSLGTHDPVVMLAGGRYYLFATGLGAKTSTNMTAWSNAPSPLARPAWVATAVPGATNLWAPDISSFGGSYHLYYAASTFGSNRSCIGHATRAALDTGAWADHGMVVCSNMGTTDNWNAIDPNVIVDDAGTPWLAFGSFWGGLKMVKLDATGARADTMLYSIAARPGAGGALEAPFVFKRCQYYYLFMSWDRCCQGANSTYNIRVGRSTSVTGPYVDKAGVQLMQGGGTLLVQGDARWKGPGHNAVLVSGSDTFNVYHSYDAQNNGSSFLRISQMHWDADGWPISGGP